MEAENKGKRISTEQREIMLDFMKRHPALATGRFTAPDGAKHKSRLLHDLAAQLNSCSTGVTKSDDKWLKICSWQDWRSDVKAKAALLKREINKTGGGSIKEKPLTPLEEQLLGFLGPNIVGGHENVPDPLTPAPPTSAAATVTATSQQGDSEEPPLILVPTADTVFMHLDGEPELETLNVAPECSDSSSSSSIKKQSRKRKETGSVTSSLDSEYEDPLNFLAKRQLELDEVKVQLLKEQNDIARKQNEIAMKQMTAVEGACSAITRAMIAFEQYLVRH